MVTQREIQAKATRAKILEAASAEIYRVGYQSASLCDILNRLGISKGALYHHFPGKRELGYAVLDEVLSHTVESMWRPAVENDDPITGIINLLKHCCETLSGEKLEYGCPINNLAQEMSPLDEGFRTRIEVIYRRWLQKVAQSLRQAQQNGTLRSDVDADDVAAFIVSTFQGANGLAKNAQDKEIFRQTIRVLSQYLEGLRIKAA